MRDEDIARDVALEFTAEFGPALIDKVDAIHSGAPMDQPERTRGLGQDVLHTAADAAIVASFIISIVPVVRVKAARYRDRAAVAKAAAQEAAQSAASVPAKTAARIIDAVLTRIRPEK
jgi:hypothetical protein